MKLVLPYDVLPKYEGIEYECVDKPEKWGFEVTATRGDKKLKFTFPREWFYLDTPAMYERIEKALEPLVKADPPLQVDLSIKEDEE